MSTILMDDADCRTFAQKLRPGDLMHSKFERVPYPEHPDRCQAIGGEGQCPFKALPQTKYCPRHGGLQAEKRIGRANHRLYLLAQWKERFGRQADHPELKSLREDVAILRMTLEAKLDQCKDDQQLVMQAGGITEMVREIAKTVKTCQALEESMGKVLDKTQAEAWVQELGTIIGNYIEDPEILQMVAEDMLNSLEQRIGRQGQSQEQETK